MMVEEKVTLECMHESCTKGVDGGRWKTKSFSESIALEMLKEHHRMAHVSVENSGSGTAGKFEKVPRPKVSTGCSQQDFKFFKEKWNRYKSSSGVSDTALIRSQLLCCPEEELQQQLSRILGNRLDTITETDLLKEIETLAVEKQSNLVNMVGLLSAVQDRDEPVRQFVARLRGLAAVCELTINALVV